nr:hypothetical protein [Tanacetum cinerariifolium]
MSDFETKHDDWQKKTSDLACRELNNVTVGSICKDRQKRPEKKRSLNTSAKLAQARPDKYSGEADKSKDTTTSERLVCRRTDQVRSHQPRPSAEVSVDSPTKMSKRYCDNNNKVEVVADKDDATPENVEEPLTMNILGYNDFLKLSLLFVNYNECLSFCLTFVVSTLRPVTQNSYNDDT